MTDKISEQNYRLITIVSEQLTLFHSKKESLLDQVVWLRGLDCGADSTWRKKLLPKSFGRLYQLLCNINRFVLSFYK